MFMVFCSSQLWYQLLTQEVSHALSTTANTVEMCMCITKMMHKLLTQILCNEMVETDEDSQTDVYT